MPTLAARFEAKVGRSGEHHLWTGARHSDGSGLMKANGKPTTARRIAWELENGALSSGARVAACPADPACVRMEHLSLQGEGTGDSGSTNKRAPRGAGTKRELRPGVWKLTVTAGRWDDGTPRRVHRTVQAAGSSEAAALLADFAGEVRSAPLPEARSDRDIIVDEAVERFLAEHLVAEKGREERPRGSGPGGTRRGARAEPGCRDGVGGPGAQDQSGGRADRPFGLRAACSGGTGVKGCLGEHRKEVIEQGGNPRNAHAGTAPHIGRARGR